MRLSFRFILPILLPVILQGCKYRMPCRLSEKQKVINRLIPQVDTLIVDPAVATVLHQSNYYHIRIKASIEVMPDVSFNVTGRTLRVTNNTYCLVQNPNSVAHLDFYAPDLKVIIANTDLTIHSTDTLRYNNLKLISENASVGENNIADFDLILNNNKTTIVANGTSIFKLRGFSKKLFVGFYGVNPTFLGKDLRANRVYFFQRSGGEMHLFPIQSIEGDLYGYGNVYIYHRPDTVNIRKHYAGNVVWMD